MLPNILVSPRFSQKVPTVSVIEPIDRFSQVRLVGRFRFQSIIQQSRFFSARSQTSGSKTINCDRRHNKQNYRRPPDELNPVESSSIVNPYSQKEPQYLIVTATHIQTGEDLVAKVLEAPQTMGFQQSTRPDAAAQDKKANKIPNAIYNQARYYQNLQGGPGIPKMRWFGLQCGHYYLVMQRLGKNIIDLKKQSGLSRVTGMTDYIQDQIQQQAPQRIFSFKTTIQICIQVCKCLHYLALKSIVHGNVCGQNIMSGYGQDCDKIYLIGFGKEGAKVPYPVTKNNGDSEAAVEQNPCIYKLTSQLIKYNNWRYSSYNHHCGNLVTPIDDLLALMHLMSELMGYHLPWTTIQSCENNCTPKKAQQLQCSIRNGQSTKIPILNGQQLSKAFQKQQLCSEQLQKINKFILSSKLSCKGTILFPHSKLLCQLYDALKKQAQIQQSKQDEVKNSNNQNLSETPNNQLNHKMQSIVSDTHLTASKTKDSRITSSQADEQKSSLLVNIDGSNSKSLHAAFIVALRSELARTEETEDGIFDWMLDSQEGISSDCFGIETHMNNSNSPCNSSSQSSQSPHNASLSSPSYLSPILQSVSDVVALISPILTTELQIFHNQSLECQEDTKNSLKRKDVGKKRKGKEDCCIW